MPWATIKAIDPSLRGKLIRVNATIQNGLQPIPEGSVGLCYEVNFISLSIGFNRDPKTAPSRFTSFLSFASTAKVSLFDIEKLTVEDTADRGNYFALDGSFNNVVGNSQDVYIVGKPLKLSLTYDDLVDLAATAWGESSVGYNIEGEIFAIANTMVNHKTKFGKYPLAYAKSNNTKNYSDLKIAANSSRNNLVLQKGTAAAINDTFLKKAIAAAINAVTGGTDYSNEATHWAGNDIGSKNEKWAETLKFTSPEHDLFNLGDNVLTEAHKGFYQDGKGKNTTVRGAWTYKWETTAAYGIKGKTGTTFMRVSNDYKKATGSRGQ